MSTIINASTSSGLVQTADNSGTLVLQSNGTSAAGVSGSNFQCDSGYGSVATAYGCRAWVNFNGTGTVAIRASGNVTSITDNGVGDYTVNFTTAMPDVNYSLVGTAKAADGASANVGFTLSTAASTYLGGSCRVRTGTLDSGSTAVDSSITNVAIFR